MIPRIAWYAVITDEPSVCFVQAPTKTLAVSNLRYRSSLYAQGNILRVSRLRNEPSDKYVKHALRYAREQIRLRAIIGAPE